MGTIWVREFTGGLDARRLPETSAGGTLIRAKDCHINRGGEVEQRADFLKLYSAPLNATVGLAADRNGLVVFKVAQVPLQQQVLPFGVTGDPLAVPLELRVVLGQQQQAGHDPRPELLDHLGVTEVGAQVPVRGHGTGVDELHVAPGRLGRCGVNVGHGGPFGSVGSGPVWSRPGGNNCRRMATSGSPECTAPAGGLFLGDTRAWVIPVPRCHRYLGHTGRRSHRVSLRSAP